MIGYFIDSNNMIGYFIDSNNMIGYFIDSKNMIGLLCINYTITKFQTCVQIW